MTILANIQTYLVNVLGFMLLTYNTNDVRLYRLFVIPIQNKYIKKKNVAPEIFDKTSQYKQLPPSPRLIKHTSPYTTKKKNPFDPSSLEHAQ